MASVLSAHVATSPRSELTHCWNAHHNVITARPAHHCDARPRGRVRPTGRIMAGRISDHPRRRIHRFAIDDKAQFVTVQCFLFLSNRQTIVVRERADAPSGFIAKVGCLLFGFWTFRLLGQCPNSRSQTILRQFIRRGLGKRFSFCDGSASSKQ